MNEIMIIAVYCFVDEFIKTVTGYPIGRIIMDRWEGNRGPKKRLGLAEAMALNILRFYFRIQDPKAFHRLAVNSFGDCFPGMPNYENFVKASNRSFLAAAVFMKYLLFLNRIKNRKGVYCIDSTALSVCQNPCISTHKAAKGFASRGKTGKGWFYGFKAHGVCAKEGIFLAYCSRQGAYMTARRFPRQPKTLGDYLREMRGIC
jgi:hypothetical protein